MNSTRGRRLLQEYVDTLGGTKQAFAETCGVSPTLLSHFLSGRRRPTLEAVFSIQAATDGAVPAEAWLDDEDRDGKAETGVRARPS
jgi:DNA-binding transcriptional regulator YdaS (Cro superfamily)